MRLTEKEAFFDGRENIDSWWRDDIEVGEMAEGYVELEYEEIEDVGECSKEKSGNETPPELFLHESQEPGKITEVSDDCSVELRWS